MKATIDEVVWDYAAGLCGGLAAALVVIQFMSSEGLNPMQFLYAIGVTLGFYAILVISFMAVQKTMGTKQ